MTPPAGGPRGSSSRRDRRLASSRCGDSGSTRMQYEWRTATADEAPASATLAAMTTSVDELAWRAPDIYSAWAGIEAGEESSIRREVRRVAGRSSAEDVRVELASLTEELANVVRTLRDDAFALPGGEADWNVAETLGHTVQARVGLTLAASLAA